MRSIMASTSETAMTSRAPDPAAPAPIFVAAPAGPNGAGKSTFYHSHLKPSGLLLVNADVIARELALGDAAATRVTAAQRGSAAPIP